MSRANESVYARPGSIDPRGGDLFDGNDYIRHQDGITKREALVIAQAPAAYKRFSDGFVSVDRAALIAKETVMMSDAMLVALDGETYPEHAIYRNMLRELLRQIDLCAPVDHEGNEFLSNEAVRDARALLGSDGHPFARAIEDNDS